MYKLPCNVSRLPGGSISFGLVGWLVVTSGAAGGLAAPLRDGALAMDTVLVAVFAGGKVGVGGPLKEIVVFSGTGSDTAVTGISRDVVNWVGFEEGRGSFCATLAAGFVGA